MLTIKIIVFIITSCVVLLKEVNSDFTLERYFGIWHQVGLLVPHNKKSDVIPCEWFEVKKSFLCASCIEEVYGKLKNGSEPLRRKGFGSISSHNYMTVSYPDLRKPRFHYRIETFMNGSELILFDDRAYVNSKILSETHTASIATKTRFESVAIEQGLYAIYADPDECVTIVYK